MRVALLPLNGTDAAPKACNWSVSAATPAGAVYKCKPRACLVSRRCLEGLGFRCTGAYRLRVQAKGRGKALLDSAWSQDLEWKATCEGDVGKACYA